MDAVSYRLDTMQLSWHLGIGLDWQHLRRQPAVGNLHRRDLLPLLFHDAGSIQQVNRTALVESSTPRNSRVRVTRCNQSI